MQNAFFSSFSVKLYLAMTQVHSVSPISGNSSFLENKDTGILKLSKFYR